MSELKSCPFCGGTDLIDDFTSGGYRWMHVRCRCAARGPMVPIDYTDYDTTRMEARAAWNRRVNDATEPCEECGAPSVGRTIDDVNLCGGHAPR